MPHSLDSKPRRREIRGLVFDFDGLIVDTEVPAFRSWEEIYEEHGCKLPLSSWVTLIGTSARPFEPFDYLQEQYGRPLDRISIEERRQRRRIELVEAEPLLPGIKDYLENARRLGLRLGVASSSAHDWVDGHLHRLGIHDQFHCIKCREDVSNTKPSPDLYLAAITALEVLPEETIAFEDSPNGIIAAKKAGLFCVAVPNTLTAELSIQEADLIIPSLAELPLERLLSVAETRT